MVKLRFNTRWTPEDDATLLASEGQAIAAVAKHLGRTCGAVLKRMAALEGRGHGRGRPKQTNRPAILPAKPRGYTREEVTLAKLAASHPPEQAIPRDEAALLLAMHQEGALTV